MDNQPCKPCDEEKVIGQFKLHLNGVFQAFHGYGHDVYIPESINQITELALQLHKRLNGEDIPMGGS